MNLKEQVKNPYKSLYEIQEHDIYEDAIEACQQAVDEEMLQGYATPVYDGFGQIRKRKLQIEITEEEYQSLRAKYIGGE